MTSTGEKPAWNTNVELVTNSKMGGLVTPYNLPKSVNVLVKSNQKVLLGAISIDNLRSKNAPTSFTGSLIVHKPTQQDGLTLIEKQPIKFKANNPASRQYKFELIRPIVIEPDSIYRLRFVFDNSWTPRNFYCLTKIIEYDTKIDGTTTITITPEKINGDVIENELPLILYFNRL